MKLSTWIGKHGQAIIFWFILYAGVSSNMVSDDNSYHNNDNNNTNDDDDDDIATWDQSNYFSWDLSKKEGLIFIEYSRLR